MPVDITMEQSNKEWPDFYLYDYKSPLGPDYKLFHWSHASMYIVYVSQYVEFSHISMVTDPAFIIGDLWPTFIVGEL